MMAAAEQSKIGRIGISALLPRNGVVDIAALSGLATTREATRSITREKKIDEGLRRLISLPSIFQKMARNRLGD